MSISQAISSHIPYLRRFSRALTGSQAGGDAYVLATLEAIVADPSAFEKEPDVRTALYRLFLKVWSSVSVNDHVDDIGFSGDEVGAHRNLEAITLRPRIAFLLSSLEGFNTAEVAATLVCSIDEAAALIDAAGKEIANQIRTDVVIIEDEPFIALDLQTLVEEQGHRVIAVARTHREAVEAVNKERPGLILADIQLADGSSGLEAVNEILGSFSVPVIFITAYPERFLTGAPPEPAFLITKPFGVDSLKAVISQALFFDRKSHRKDEPESKSALV
ncbi:Phyllosphere-induced regulator PhyR [Methylocella tundrae]|uniref:Phyllosphere-induced regulator PhyR n=1 Tax=Methylocella tundrae TaxID=227605 RepID=A0A8B6M998_METTU|nr:response regulator [Methylocella tundrae]VTZ51577.1 Phyllosphere-induced regulator PhyR [Methylocella tundrae]